MHARTLLLLALVLAGPWLWNEYSADYFAHTSRIYYPHSYFGPARTGLPSSQYYYPGNYVNSAGWFRSYREYTHAAYRYPGVVAAVPYTGPRNPWY